MRRSFTSHAPRSARFTPGLEALESRWCPAAGISQSGQALLIQGDGANDVVCVRDNGQGGVTASIALASGTKTFSATGITAITINAGGGNDTIKYALTGALSQQESLALSLGKGSSQATLDFSAGLAGAALAVDVDGGAGSNQLTTSFGAVTNSRINLIECLGQGGATSHVEFNAPLTGSLATVTVNGGAGVDQVFAAVGAASSSNLQFAVNLGSGADSFDLEESGSLHNAVVHFDVDTGAGPDTIAFNALGVDVDATSRLNLEACAGKGNDKVTLNYSGQLNGELDVDLQGGPGKDAMSVVVTLAPGSTGRIHLDVDGGAGDDVVSVSVFDNSGAAGHSKLALLDAVLDGGAGHNTLSATPNVKVIQ